MWACLRLRNGPLILDLPVPVATGHNHFQSSWLPGPPRNTKKYKKPIGPNKFQSQCHWKWLHHLEATINNSSSQSFQKKKSFHPQKHPQNRLGFEVLLFLLVLLLWPSGLSFFYFAWCVESHQTGRISHGSESWSAGRPRSTLPIPRGLSFKTITSRFKRSFSWSLACAKSYQKNLAFQPLEILVDGSKCWEAQAHSKCIKDK